jgi:heme a synthase
MSVELVQHGGDAAFLAPARARSSADDRLSLRRWGGALESAVLAVTTIAACFAFVLGVGNRFTRGPLFIYIPEIDLIPPLSKPAWEQAFIIHQQSPLFALCGGYQVGGMESLTVYQLLYMWEWLRTGSMYVLAGCVILLCLIAVGRLVRTTSNRELVPLIVVAALAGLYLLLRALADHAGAVAAINVGQHRHAVDVTFASLGLALLLVATLSRSLTMPSAIQIGFATFIALDIAFGALFEATDASVVWTTFPGYADGPLPATDRLLAFSPLWRNFTENVYLIQACHRVLSIAVWIAALAALAWALWCRGRIAGSLLLAGLLTLDGALGIATLKFDVSPVLSTTHQAVAVLVLAAALASGLWRPLTSAARAEKRRPTGAPGVGIV